jgi:hypothetical protein
VAALELSREENRWHPKTPQIALSKASNATV